MFWKTANGKILLITLLSILLLSVVVVLPGAVDRIRLRSQPIQNEQVIVAGKEIIKQRPPTRRGYKKGATIPYYVVTFKLSDGSMKELRVDSAVFNDLQENDTGKLSFQEQKNATHFNHRRFISFEKDEP